MKYINNFFNSPRLLWNTALVLFWILLIVEMI